MASTRFLQARRRTNSGRHLGAVEIGSQADAVVALFAVPSARPVLAFQHIS
jgi:hypothetical protein